MTPIVPKRHLSWVALLALVFFYKKCFKLPSVNMSQIFDPFILLRTIGPVRNRKQKSAQGRTPHSFKIHLFQKTFSSMSFLFWNALLNRLDSFWSFFASLMWQTLQHATTCKKFRLNWRQIKSLGKKGKRLEWRKGSIFGHIFQYISFVNIFGRNFIHNFQFVVPSPRTLARLEREGGLDGGPHFHHRTFQCLARSLF